MKPVYWIFLLVVVFGGGLTIGYLVTGASKGKSAFISTDVLFAGFEMRKELNNAAEKIKNSRQKKLDSLKFEYDRTLNFYKKNPSLQTQNMAETQRQVYLTQEQQFIEDESKINREYSDQIWKQLNQYVADYGKENGYRYIFGANGTGALMYADDADDITQELIVFANQKYKGAKP